MKIEIKHRFTDSVLFSLETESFKLCVEAAVKSGANLSGADLSGANLSGADLSGANLRRADLSWADLSEANLSGANLSGADLSKANLYRANLYEANLSWANLSGADLSGANLSGADLSKANLYRANLSGADLRIIKADYWAVLSSAPREVPALITALAEGRVNGSSYEGECACLVGTIANACHLKFNQMATLKPNSDRPAERFFLGIKTGDTPNNNQISALAVEWAREWLDLMQKAFGSKE